jgi:hypothetical protein
MPFRLFDVAIMVLDKNGIQRLVIRHFSLA